ncbi:hypothetical protein DsansV1_C15g0135141 [Dioscorea sansibarensis]
MVGWQDSYALCRVFKKNVVCGEVEDQGQCSLSMIESSQGLTSSSTHDQYYDQLETVSPDTAVGSSPCIDEDDKDDSWMQFITEEAWCSNVSTSEPCDDLSTVAAYAN